MPEAAPLDREEAPTTAPRRPARTFLALAVLIGALGAVPAFADTKGQLDAAKQKLASAQVRADQATAAWQQAEADLAQTKDAIVATRADIEHLRSQVDRLNARLEKRAVVAFENGPGSAIDSLLASSSITDFADRMEFLGSLAESDVSLVADARVAEEQLRRETEDLTALSAKQALIAQDRHALEQAAAGYALELQRQVTDLTAKYREELQAQKQLSLLGQHTNPGGAIAVCPVAGPNSFVDSFGWPRPGGRVHQGIDMISPYGTPIVAVQPGNAVRTPNALGGNAVMVYGPGGDFTYYAHMSSYGAAGSVSVGTVIGYVGSTGDTSVNHLHFEYHPGGGSAVDPYQALLAVC